MVATASKSDDPKLPPNQPHLKRQLMLCQDNYAQLSTISCNFIQDALILEIHNLCMVHVSNGLGWLQQNSYTKKREIKFSSLLCVFQRLLLSTEKTHNCICFFISTTESTNIPLSSSCQTNTFYWHNGFHLHVGSRFSRTIKWPTSMASIARTQYKGPEKVLGYMGTLKKPASCKKCFSQISCYHFNPSSMASKNNNRAVKCILGKLGKILHPQIHAHTHLRCTWQTAIQQLQVY